MKWKEMSGDRRLSCSVVRYLRKRYGTLKAVGRLAGTGVAFMSLVASGKRSMTLYHLERIETATGMPLPLLLVGAAQKGSVPARFWPRYLRMKKFLDK